MATKRTKKSDKLGLSCAKLWSASKLTLLALVNLKAKFINMIGKLDLFDQQNDMVELTNRFI